MRFVWPLPSITYSDASWMLSAIQRAPAPSGPASIGVRQSSLPVMTSVGAVTFAA